MAEEEELHYREWLSPSKGSNHVYASINSYGSSVWADVTISSGHTQVVLSDYDDPENHLNEIQTLIDFLSFYMNEIRRLEKLVNKDD